MVMGAVCEKNANEIYIQALLAGMNMFLYRNSDEKLLSIIDNISSVAKNDKKLQDSIDKSFEKVLKLKQKYKISI